ncbi:hypothetical protein E3U43_007820 [Larimichthys crocea]|uniref:Uncharacterized protein n=1 Tax=Larimichthys crocea TaxID=215358 RepID=A0ACD3Q535_LARCR|nr:hypothetical protein E3U43_007820 [Larimichthys crocea]
MANSRRSSFIACRCSVTTPTSASVLNVFWNIPPPHACPPLCVVFTVCLIHTLAVEAKICNISTFGVGDAILPPPHSPHLTLSVTHPVYLFECGEVAYCSF